MLLEQERKDIVKYSRMMIDKKLTTGTGGNLSIFNRKEKLIAITPTGIPYHDMTPEDVVVMDINCNVVDGNRFPSSEKEMHAIVYRTRDDLNAMVHNHSVFAAAVSATGKPLPAVDYLVAFGGGKDVRCAEYATYGSPELAQNAIKAMKDRNAVLLANHGINVCADTLGTALAIAEQLEFCCEVYVRAKSTGEEVQILSDEEMARNVKKFVTYGYQK